MNDAERLALIQKIARLRKSCETLEFENIVFENYYRREKTQGGKDIHRKSSEPTTELSSIIRPPSEQELEEIIEKIREIECQNTMKDLSQVVTAIVQKTDDGNVENVVTQKSSNSQTVINFGICPSLNRLSNENKADLVMTEIDEVEHEISWAKECTERSMHNGKAVLEFLEQKNKDNIKSQAEFEREARNSIHYSSKAYQAEKIERFFEEKKRMKEALVKKIALKTGTLGQQLKKINVQLQQKEEMGGVLHKVDLEQLQFENQQYQEKIEAKNRLLLEAKKKQTLVGQALINKKRKMKEFENEADSRQRELELKLGTCERLKTETEEVKVELNAAKSDLEDLQITLSTYRVPDTMRYIKNKSQLDQLRQQTKTWIRKVEIAEIRHKDLGKKWRKACKLQQLQKS